MNPEIHVARTAPSRSIAIVTCYRHPDYVRAASLRAAARASGLFHEVHVVKNRRRGVLRYVEVVLALVRLAFDRPDSYLVTFRGYEILPFVLLLSGRRPVYYDEFINPVEWFVHEHHRFPPSSRRARMLRAAFRSMMRRCTGVLADTPSHADYSATLMDLPRSLYHPVAVGTDEATFHPIGKAWPTDRLRVLYYGSMLPLHGLEIVLDAARALADDERVSFTFVGGDDDDARAIAAAGADGARVGHRTWVPYAELPALFAEHELMLGGPFGDTVQSRYVVTGKTYQFLACALPTVVGENLESWPFLDRGNALVVRQGDPAALAATIRWAADHPGELAGIGRAGRELYERLFSVDRIAGELGRALGADQLADVEDARHDEQ